MMQLKEIKALFPQFRMSYEQLKSQYPDKLRFEEEAELNMAKLVDSRIEAIEDADKRKVLQTVAAQLKDPSYHFTASDTDQLSMFIGNLNGLFRVANRLNNFKEGSPLDRVSF